MRILPGAPAVGPAEATAVAAEAAGAQEAAVKEQDLLHSRKQNSALEREVQRFKERDVLTKKVHRRPPPRQSSITSIFRDKRHEADQPGIRNGLRRRTARHALCLIPAGQTHLLQRCWVRESKDQLFGQSRVRSGRSSAGRAVT